MLWGVRLKRKKERQKYLWCVVLSSRLLFCAEIFRKTQIEGKAAKLVEAKSHCLYYENYEATQTAKCRGLEETAHEIAATLEVSADFLKGSTFSNSESWLRRNC